MPSTFRVLSSPPLAATADELAAARDHWQAAALAANTECRALYTALAASQDALFAETARTEALRQAHTIERRAYEAVIHRLRRPWWERLIDWVVR